MTVAVGYATPRTTPPRPTTHPRVLGLDGLRGVAVLCVMASHFMGARGSGVGVDVFFGLSAFLITSLLVAEHRRTGSISFAGFYRRRAARLLPALLVLVVVVGPLVSLAIGSGRQVPLSSLWVVTYLTDFASAQMLPFSQPYVHTWSLSVEEQFYVLWPAVLLVLLRLRVRLVPFAVAFGVAGLGASVLVFKHLGWLHNYYLPTDHLVALAAGAAVAFWVTSDRAPRLRPIVTGGVAGAALAALVGLAFVPYAGWPLAGAQATTAATAVLTAVVLAHLAVQAAGARASGAAALLRSRGLVWFGTRSYGLYLYHVPLFLVVKKCSLPGPWIVLTSAAVGLSLVLAEASYRWLEQPVMRWSRARA